MNHFIRRYLPVPVLLTLWVAAAHSQAESAPPNAVTQPPVITSSANARLNGAVVPNGIASVAWFEWGTNSAMANTTATTNVGAGYGVVRVGLPVAGLAPRVIYHCRLVASNSLGIVRGAEQTYTTGQNVSAWGDNSSGQTTVPPGLSTAVAVAAGGGGGGGGGSHSLALKSDGRVVAWGNNNNGQTNVPVGLSNVVAIAAGAMHSLGLKADGQMVAWGYNGYGQTNVPAGLSNVVAVAAGYYHSLALISDGRVVAWGYNGDGQTNVPTGLSNVVAVAAGGDLNLALKADGRVVAWGNNSYGQTNVPADLSNVVAVATGEKHSLALKADGRVVGWGYNYSGQATAPTGLSNVVAVAAGYNYSVALTSDGRVMAWGDNYYGQSIVPAGLVNVASISAGSGHNVVLGNLPPQATSGTFSGVANQDLLVTLTGTDPNSDPLTFKITTQPAAGMLYQCLADGSRGAAITTPGTAVNDASGRVIFVPATNGFGRPYTSCGFVADDGEAISSETSMGVEILGLPLVATQPAVILGSENALLNGMVAGNGFATAAWFEWGTDSTMANATASTNTGNGVGVVRVSLPVAGLMPRVTYHCRLVASNSLGVTRSAEQLFTTGKNVSAWGDNSSGQTNVPPGLSNVVAVAAGANHNLALKSDGRLVAWGGQTNVPPGLSNVVAVAAGGYHSLALMLDGRVLDWGYNNYGQTNVPPNLSNVVALAAGGGHSLALKSDGRVVVWGSQTNVPTGLSNVVAVAGGDGHCLALKSDGQVVAWGANNYGQTNVPANLSNVVALAAGGGHSLALKSDGRVVAWGVNGYDQSDVPAGLSNVVAIAAGGSHSLALKSDGGVVAWGRPYEGQVNVPTGLGNVATISAGNAHNVALGNLPPQASSGRSSGLANRDQTITLAGTDQNKDPLSFKISTLPAAGTLYQCLPNGSRGAAINTPGTAVTDPLGRVIFAPVTNAFGVPYTSLGFVADDGEAVSDDATIEVDILGAPLVATQAAAILGVGSATLNGMVGGNGIVTTAWFEWGANSAMANTTAATNIGTTGLGVARVSLPVAGLVTRVTYHCRLVASNAFGVVRGAEQVFTTGRIVVAWGNNSSGQTNVPAGLSNAVAVAAGGRSGVAHSLALKADGRVVAWGYNAFGQTNVLAGLSNVVAVAAGENHNVALKSDGRVVAWGNNIYYGQTNVPVGLSNVVAVAAGGYHSLALKSDGRVVVWGNNVYGQTNVPAGLSNVVAVAAGDYHNVALKSDGRVVAWGDNTYYGQTNVPASLSNVVAVAAGTSHSLAATSDGRVVVWGNNTYGLTNVPTGLSNVVAVAAGGNHSLALKLDGRVVAWGDLGSVPAELVNVAAISAGAAHNIVLGNFPPQATPGKGRGLANQDLVLKLTGTDPNQDPLTFRITTFPAAGLLYQCLPDGTRGAAISTPGTVLNDALGRVTFAPATNGFGLPYASFGFVADDGAAVSSEATIEVEICGHPFVATQSASLFEGGGALLNGMVTGGGAEATVWFEWGSDAAMANTTAQTNVGVGLDVTRISLPVSGLLPRVTYRCRLVASNALGIVRGAEQRFAAGKNVSAWGSNGYGQTNVPAGLTNAVAVAAGNGHTVVLRSNQRVEAWGRNDFGQTNVPAGLTNAVAVSAGDGYNIVLNSNGRVVAWGNNGGGQTNVPPALSNVVAVAAGGNYCLALRSDGRVVAWGNNGSGQTNVPPALSNVVAIAAGGSHGLALKSDGRVVAWGNNGNGQANAPAGLTNVVAVAAGANHSLALKSDGRVVAWGYNNYGQTNVPAGLSNVVMVAGGGSHTLALQSNGRVVAWGYNGSGQTNVPSGLSNAASISAGSENNEALGNISPQASPGRTSGLANQDLVIPLTGTDPNSDLLAFKITTPPAAGTLYQYLEDGSRGAAITTPGTAVNDASGRVIFAPATNAFGRPYTSFGVVADDGESVSSEATIEVEIFGTPLATTQPAAITGMDSAMLNGMVVGNGLETTAWFEWGTDGNVVNTTAATNMGRGLELMRVSLPIGGLAPRVVYHCRLVASNSFGVTRGAEQWFTTGKNVSAWGVNVASQTNIPSGLSNVVMVAAGGSHNLALKADGRIVAWGTNTYGQLNVPVSLSNVVAVAAGSTHSLALTSDGRVVAWGYNGYGQTNVPAGLSNVVAIGAGSSSSHSLALTSDGRVVAWGNNGNGQTNVPLGLSNVVAVAAGYSHSLALTSYGRVVAWGNNNYGQTNVPQGLSIVVAVAAGTFHDLALQSDGRVVAWGAGGNGQTNVPAGLSNVVSVSAGAYFNLALKSDGRVVAWGSNSFGQTNVPSGLFNLAAITAGSEHAVVLGNLPPQAIPGRSSGVANRDLVISLTGTDPNKDPLTFKITALPGAGMLYQCLPDGNRGAAITTPSTAVNDASGRVVFAPVTNAFGRPYTSFGFVADDTEVVSGEATIKVEIFGPPLVATQSAAILGADSAMLNGTVVGNGMQTTAWFEWGTDSTMTNATTSTNTGNGLGVVRVSLPVAGLMPRVTYHCRLVASNSLGVTRGAEQLFTTGKNVSAWGDNSSGQTNVPPGLSNVVAVAAGANHNLALKSDGRLVAWGGQTNVPPGLSNVVAVAAGGDHSLALMLDGRVLDWGYNNYGQTNVPPNLSNVVAVAAGGSHSLALISDGRVVAWGYNGDGQTNVPTGLSNVVAVAGGDTHSLALTSVGQVVAWGANDFGQTNVPANLSNVVAVAGGANHSLALKADGAVVAWGNNGNGQANVPLGLSNVVAVAAGYFHSLALKSDGRLVAWGYSFNGRTNVSPDLTNVVSLAVGSSHNLVIMDGRCRIVQPPQPLNLLPGATAQFQVSVASDNPVSYQWQVNGTSLADGGKISGATSAQLNVTDVFENELGDYRVLVTHPYGVVTSSVARLQFVARQLRIGSVSAAPGTTVTVPVQLASDDGENALAFSVAYDTSLLSLVSVTNGADALDTAFTVDTSQSDSGRLGIFLARPAGTAFTNAQYELALLTFHVAAVSNALVTPLTFGDAPVTRTTSTTNSVALPTLYVAGGVSVLPSGTIALSPGSSLFQQVIRVTNPANAGGSVRGVRLWFHDLGVDAKGYPIRVYNATGTSNGVPYLDYNAPLAPGQSVNLTVEYYIADRKTIPHPRLVVEFLGLQTFLVPEGTFVSARLGLINGLGVMEFNTLAGHTYYVQYCSDLTGTNGWKTAFPAITGTGGIVQWIDNGPPKTDCAPAEAPNRFYRILFITP